MHAFSALVLASASLVAAAPLSLTQLASVVSSSLVLPNSTQNNSAVWYLQNGIMGACGLYSQDMQLVVGLPLEYYNLTGIISPYCGSYVVVTNPLNNETVTARVADASATNETLSMSVGAWRAVKGDETQMRNVTWIFANETQVDAAVAALPLVDLTVPAVTAANPTPATSGSAPDVAAAAPAPAPSSTYVQEAPAAPSSTYVYVAPTPAYVAPAPSYLAPTPVYVAPKPTPVSSSQYSGSATYYTQNGNAGACGNYNSDSAFIVAIDSAMYAGGSNCGRKVRITRTATGQSITATIADECPTCNSGTSLDLSVAAFTALAAESVGLFEMTWSWA